MTTENEARLWRILEEARRAGRALDADAILELFLGYVTELGLTPFAAQEEAILELLGRKHVILNTPTGSGKSLVALALHFQALAEGRVSYYTAPTKALVNEKFFDLCDRFGADRVGLLTGDASVNRDAPIVCCTQEILANMALRDDDVPVDYVVMDEFHYYGDKERGTAWQIPLISMRDSVFLLMSATLGDTEEIEKRLAAFTDRDVAVVRGSERPVPLAFEYREAMLHETIEALVAAGEAPIYLVNFTQRDCAEVAQNLMSIDVCSKEEKRAIAQELEAVRFDTPYGAEFQRFVRHGLGVHHAGLLPKYRRVVERLAKLGLVKVVSGTDTLGVGVNIPIRTVVLSRLYKFDGERVGILSAREFHQIAGRAGRKGFDDKGTVVVLAPEWVVENKRIEAKAVANPHLRKKLVKQKPPPRAVAWDEKTFGRLKGALPEALEPRFEVTHGMLVNLLHGGGDLAGGGYGRLVDLIARSHGTDKAKQRRRKRAAELFRSLRRAGIVSLVRNADGRGSRAAVSDTLQRDFSLHHALSLFLVAALELLDPQSATYAADALSLVEAILEDPRAVIERQVDALKGELIGRLKAEGVEYDERMERLREVEHPQPLRELLEQTFEAFAVAHPWVGGEGVRPKSVAREMFELCFEFNDYVNLYGLARSEGVLLRYLTQAYKTAVQTVPPAFWTEGFEDALAYLHGLVRRVDASLVEEWALLVDAPIEIGLGEQGPPRPPSIAESPRALRARIRNELHTLVAALSRRDYAAATSLVGRDDEAPWTAERFAEAMAPYWAEHAAIDLTPRARLASNTIVREAAHRLYEIRHKILDPEGDDDFGLDAIVDLRKPRDEALPLIGVLRIGA
jgi:hypothetical protein